MKEVTGRMLRRCLTAVLYLDLALWFGGAVYFSFFAAIELSNALSPDEFGRTIAILFPAYFTLMVITAVIGWLLLLTLSRQAGLAVWARRTALIAGTIGAIVALVNRFYFLPAITAIEARMGPFSKASPAMQQQFGMTHGISMLFDFVMVLCVLVTWISLGLGLNSGFRRD